MAHVPRQKADYGAHSRPFECPLCGRAHEAFSCETLKLDVQPVLDAIDHLEVCLSIYPNTKNGRAAMRSLQLARASIKLIGDLNW